MSKAKQQRMRRIVNRLAPDLLERELAKLEIYIKDEAPNWRLQLMAFGAKIALEFALDPTQHAPPTRMLDWTKVGLQLKNRTPKRLPVLVALKEKP